MENALLDGLSKSVIMSVLRANSEQQKGQNMKKFLVKFVDALSGRTQEKEVKGRSEQKVREGCESNCKRVLSVLVL
jgi:hypothetical protein